VYLSALLVIEVPAGVVTVTSTVPRDPAGATALIDEGVTTFTEVAGLGPNMTAVAPVNPVPVIVTGVPPVVGPDDGLMPVTVGAYVNTSSGLVAEVPAGVVTVTSAVPVPAGAVAVMEVSEFTVKLLAGALPNFTAVAPVKPLPDTVTTVCPAAGPNVGLMLVTTVEMAATGALGCDTTKDMESLAPRAEPPAVAVTFAVNSCGGACVAEQLPWLVRDVIATV
jgi:hypothetical protein